AILGDHRPAAPGDGLGDVVAAIVAATGQGDEGIPRAAATAVEAQTRDDSVPRETEARQQVGEARGEVGSAGGHHRRSPRVEAVAARKSWPATCSSGTASGGTRNRRRASAVTLA